MTQPSEGSERSVNRPPLERMHRIHQELMAGQYPNAVQLGKSLEVNPKTIRRDLDFMRDRLNLPIEYSAQKLGFYYTKPVTEFPTLQISEGELFALVIAEKALQQYRGTSFEKPLLSAIRKIERALPDTVSMSLADLNQTISFRTSVEPAVDLPRFEELARATSQRQRLEILYRKPGQKEPERRVIDPYHLANINGEWYLFAHDHLRNDIRTFVPARIKSMRTTGETFHRPEHFSLDTRLRGSFGVHSPEGQFDVRIQFSARVADYILERKWHDSQTVTELPGGDLEVRMRLSSLREVERWVLSWGGEAVVLHPPELAAAVKRGAEKIARNQP